MFDRVWLITGAAGGFGRRFTETALANGDRVVATARRPAALEDLAAQYSDRVLVLPLDVTDRAAVFAAVERAVDAFGRLDVVVNNAGYGLMGAVEEVSEAEARAILDTNFFGALWVTQAVLPCMRAQRGGHIVQISSVSGRSAAPTMGMYAASKFALEGMSEALAREVESFGIKVTLIEPDMYATEFATRGLRQSTPQPAYDEVRAALARQYADVVWGDPAEVAHAVLDLVRSDKPPLRRRLEPAHSEHATAA
jgi:NAD(P)-dependent dehydrogenase (short-subunit alcohol dehydrogenase family)